MTKAKAIIKKMIEEKIEKLRFRSEMEGKHKEWEEARNYSKELQGEIKELLEALEE